MDELLKKIPPEICWAITAKSLWRLIMRGGKHFAPDLGIGEGAVALGLGKEKYDEINQKLWGDYGRRFLPMIKEIANLTIEDAIGAAKLELVSMKLWMGPEYQSKITEATPQIAIVRSTKCTCMDSYNEFEVNPAFRNCDLSHQAHMVEGFKLINPKVNFKLTKAMSRGDPYCEFIYKFKEE